MRKWVDFVGRARTTLSASSDLTYRTTWVIGQNYSQWLTNEQLASKIPALASSTLYLLLS